MPVPFRHRLILLAIAALYVAMSIIGITWGLPSRSIDPYLFGDDEPWSGEKIYRLAKAGEKLSDEAIRSRGADVDVDPVRPSQGPHRVDDEPASSPLTRESAPEDDSTPQSETVTPGATVGLPDSADSSSPGATVGLPGSADSTSTPNGGPDPEQAPGDEPINLTATDEDIARIYLRYRLYTYQPDEMITMMALAGMRPGELKLDPRLYQYGGLWIYPVGALIKLCGLVGLIDVRSDLIFYLDNPDEFGKFYVVARTYAAAWGLLGVFVVFAITRRLLGDRGNAEVSTDTIERQPDHDGVRAASASTGTIDRAPDGDTVREQTPDGGTVREQTPDGDGVRAASASERSDESTTADLDSLISSSESQSQISNLKSQIRSTRAGLLAAFLFTLMPVVVCMAHEGKPHLPGAVLMLLAVYCAMRAAEQPAHSDANSDSIPSARTAKFSSRSDSIPSARATNFGSRSDSIPSARTTNFSSRGRSALAEHHSAFRIPHSAYFWLMCLCCGSAIGMVLSSGPILVLIPIVAWIRAAGMTRPTVRREKTGQNADEIQAASASERSGESQISNLKSQIRHWFAQTITGVFLALAVYLITNPYILINTFTNRDVLASNFGNSLGMYEIARVGEGFLRVLELTVEGATLPVVALGFVALAIAIFRRNRMMIPLVAAAAVFFLQFVLIGAGKPAEYGRFGIFPNTALAIGTAILLTRRWTGLGGIMSAMLSILLVAWCAVPGAAYLVNFVADCGTHTTRIQCRHALAGPLSFVYIPDNPDFGVDRTIQKNIPQKIGLISEPAPYNCPPLDFAKKDILLFRSLEAARQAALKDWKLAFIVPLDSVHRRIPPRRQQWMPQRFELRLPYWILDQPTPISWAGKFFEIDDTRRVPY